jgi:hypothetical protein
MLSSRSRRYWRWSSRAVASLSARIVCGSMAALSDQLTYERLRGQGVVVTGGNQLLSELYQNFGSAEGQVAMQINLEEIVSKLSR